MMIYDNITAVVITFNEEANLARTLSALPWVKHILVVDSFSTDRTLEIARSYPNVEILQREFDTFAAQCNFALQNVKTPWVLSLDADYQLTPELSSELLNLEMNHTYSGYEVRFRYCINGRPLRGTLYPPRVVLYRRDRASYINDGHAHHVHIIGQIKKLSQYINHDDRKPLTRWLASQASYARQEAYHLLAKDSLHLGLVDRLRLRIWPAAPLAFIYTLLAKRCLFDGWAGWCYALQRTYAELLLSLELLDRKLAPTPANVNHIDENARRAA